MPKKTYDVAVFVGRFQPFHIGHKSVIREALNVADHAVVLVGSSYRPRTSKNPFLFDEVAEMAAGSFSDDEQARLTFLPLVDTIYDDDSWVQNVRTAVGRFLRYKGLSPDSKVTLIGYEKDSSSYYLKLFPGWASVGVTPMMSPVDPSLVLSAVQIRRALYGQGDEPERVLETVTPTSTRAVLERLQTEKAETWNAVMDEANYVKEYRARVDAGEQAFGFPFQIVTVDAVVIQGGHILLVKRGRQPGIGLYALPGGHIDRDERLADAMVRELKEETKIDAPGPVIQGHVTRHKMYEHPDRSERARVMTMAYLIELPIRNRDSDGNYQLDKIKAGDDAATVEWVPLSEIDPRMMFEDHFDIIQDLTKTGAISYGNILMAHLR